MMDLLFNIYRPNWDVESKESTSGVLVEKESKSK